MRQWMIVTIHKKKWQPGDDLGAPVPVSSAASTSSWLPQRPHRPRSPLELGETGGDEPQPTPIWDDEWPK